MCVCACVQVCVYTRICVCVRVWTVRECVCPVRVGHLAIHFLDFHRFGGCDGGGGGYGGGVGGRSGIYWCSLKKHNGWIYGWMDGPTDRLMDLQIDRPSHRDARTQKVIQTSENALFLIQTWYF